MKCCNNHNQVWNQEISLGVVGAFMCEKEKKQKSLGGGGICKNLVNFHMVLVF